MPFTHDHLAFLPSFEEPEFAPVNREVTERDDDVFERPTFESREPRGCVAC